MQLTFEHHQTGIASGGNPVAYHSPDNIIQVLFTNAGNLYSTEAQTPLGEFADRDFRAPTLAAQDTGIAHLKLRYLPKVNLFVLWHSANRQRKAVFLMKQEISKYLEYGSISISQQSSPTQSMTLALANPEGIIGAENESKSEVFPGSRIIVFFKSGSSERVQIGSFYIDRIRFGVTDETLDISSRNLSGKLLTDQTFDEENTYATGNLSDILDSVLEDARVPLYAVEFNGRQQAVEFPPDMSISDGIKELINLTDDWIIQEKHDNSIVIGSPTFNRFDQKGIYRFYRDTDCFSRERTREDAEVYSRVCVHDKDFIIAEYRDVSFLSKWNLPRKKTLYVSLPDGATLTTAQNYANKIRDSLSSVGIVETFVGPFRPQLQPGDIAEIVDATGVNQIGVVTEVRHSFGKNGYMTEFTSDSGGKLKKLSLADWITLLNKKKDSSSITITE
jgi:hypothetical protein